MSCKTPYCTEVLTCFCAEAEERESAFQAGQAEERRRVVEWLRSDVSIGLSRRERGALTCAAEDIEAGEHVSWEER